MLSLASADLLRVPLKHAGVNAASRLVTLSNDNSPLHLEAEPKHAVKLSNFMDAQVSARSPAALLACASLDATGLRLFARRRQRRVYRSDCVRRVLRRATAWRGRPVGDL